MSYCQNSSKATVNYKFPEEKEEIYVANNPPIDISVSQLTGQFNSVSQSYSFSFDGNQLMTYSYTCQAPAGVPLNAVCFITSGTWDDSGTIGSYSSPTVYGQINSFSGNPVQIGQGLQFTGSVSNVIRPDCSVGLTLQWRWGGWKIEILKDGTVIHSDQGQNKPQFTVACDSDCPPGQERISTVEYPGYKCCEKCPPETCCECDRGDVICCYGSNGQVLKTIRK
jgi:hypothetical protein